jgi:hypothetical protein
MLKRLCLITIILSAATMSFGQTGSIGGTVLDLKTNEAIIGASVVIQGTTVGSATDVEGNFLISNVKPGTYVIVVSYVAYKTQTVADVVVQSNNKTSLAITLVEDIAELEEVVVTARKEIATDINLLQAIRESKLVVSGISSEQLVKLPDRDAAQVAQRVPGITIQDGRFVLVRGLPERYNQVMINNTIGPSTEIDKRSFSFDLMPAGTIDQMLIYKSGAAELPGDFAGGVIQLVTKSPSYDGSTSFGLNFGFRTNTTFQDFYKNYTGETDFLGFDNGGRDLPDGFPSTDVLKNTNRNSLLRESAGKSLTNSFPLNQKTAVPDMGFNFSTSNNFRVGSLRFSNLTSLAYSNGYTHYTADFIRYNTFSAAGVDERFRYLDNSYSNDVRVNIMHNWLFNINDANRLEFKNLFVQLGEDKTTLRDGTDYIQRPGDTFNNYAYHYLSRTIYTGQLQGDHTIGDGASKIGWVLGVNYIKRNEPDYRRFRTYRSTSLEGTEEPFIMQLPPSANLFEAGRFWSDLTDIGLSNGVNFERKFGDVSSKRTPTLKAGYLLERKTRSFNARYMNYLYPGFFDQAEGQRLIRLPVAEIFSPENIKHQDGFVIEEGTTNIDHYDGENNLAAGYVSGLLPLGKLDLSAGFRAEYNVQKLTALGNDGVPVLVNNPVFAPLPLLNAAYNFSDRSLLRLAYSRTVNRPEFRELAPFLYYQFEFESALIGNVDLKTAFIHNVDLRYEFYPNPGEIISVGAFYKKLKDPIELFLQVTTDVPQLVYNNSSEAYDAGLEVEYRKSLANFGVSRFLRNTSLNLNAAWIKSEVDIGATAGGNLARYRPLQGQSPYILNAGVYYNDEEKGYSFNAALNVFGPRIFLVGDINYPTMWELPRKALDLQAAKKFGDHFEVKFNIQNLLNAPFQILQDDNFDQEIKRSEALVQKYRVGTQYSLSLAWKFDRFE